MSLLEVRNVVSGYGTTKILHGVSMEVNQDQIVTIIGPNGCGKSTLFKTIMGYLKPMSGQVFFQGRDVSTLKPNQKVELGMAYVPQLNNVFASLTIEENMEMAGFSKDKAALKKGMDYAFATFPILKDKIKARAWMLSGGQRQMLGMAMALITEPSLIMLDEPSAGLDPQTTEAVFKQIQDIHGQGIGIAIIEQDAKRSLQFSHQGYVLAMGQNQFEGPADTLLDNEEIRKAYLGE
jgi:ABC-type branched-subunit amino acid transport system ATPase component